MNVWKPSGVLAVIVASALAGAGAAQASPAPAPAPVDIGSFQVATTGGNIELRSGGQVLGSLPLSYSIAGNTYSFTPAVGADSQAPTQKEVAHQVANDAVTALSHAVPGTNQAAAPEPAPGPAPAAPMDRGQAMDNLGKQIAVGWNNAGPQSTAIGAGIGFAVGCVSIFPNFIAGCIVGTAVGTAVGAGAGVVNGNPQVQPAVSSVIDTFLP